MKKIDKEAIVLIVILIILLTYVFSMMYGAIKESFREYEYAKDGVIGKSKECYQNDDGECLCRIGNNFIDVDNYYEVSK